MQRVRPSSPAVLFVVFVLALGLANFALAASPTEDGAIDSASDVHGHNHAQHGEDSGHLPPSATDNIELIGRMHINQDQAGRVSDVGVLGNHAFLGAFFEPRCQKGGVYVFDISNPVRPKQVNFIRTGGNSYVGEGVQAIHISTPLYTGDVLVLNNEICGPVQPSTVGGVSFVDVTDPKRHRFLSEGVGDFDPPSFNGPDIAHASHSVFMWETEPEAAGAGNAYAVMIDNEESHDLDILDITDPRNPELIAEYDLNADFPQIIDPVKGDDESFSHDMIVKEIDGRFLMLASYWDGGYVILDVTDPSVPAYVGDSDFSPVDPELFESTGLSEVPEGNAHQAEFSADDQYIVAADEDFNPYSVSAAAADDGPFSASQGSDTPQLAQGQTIEGQAVFVGRACSSIGDPAVPPAPATPDSAGQIAVVERGVCTFTEKVAEVDAAGGYEAIVIFNREGSDACTGTLGMSVAGGTPTFGVVGRDVGFGWFEQPYDDAACLAGNGSVTSGIAQGALGDVLTFESYFDGWGYVHLFENGEGKLTELDTYAIPEAHDPDFAVGFGDLSVHEVAMSQVDPSIAYFAYYSGGFRVAEIQDGELVEIGHYIGEGGQNFWGVQLWTPTSGPYAGQELVLASDRDYGVYIFRVDGVN